MWDGVMAENDKQIALQLPPSSNSGQMKAEPPLEATGSQWNASPARSQDAVTVITLDDSASEDEEPQASSSTTGGSDTEASVPRGCGDKGKAREAGLKREPTLEPGPKSARDVIVLDDDDDDDDDLERSEAPGFKRMKKDHSYTWEDEDIYQVSDMMGGQDPDLQIVGYAHQSAESRARSDFLDRARNSGSLKAVYKTARALFRDVARFSFGLLTDHTKHTIRTVYRELKRATDPDLSVLPAFAGIVLDADAYDGPSLFSSFARPFSLSQDADRTDSQRRSETEEEALRNILSNISADVTANGHADMPEGLMVNLLRHQLEALAWMKRAEEGHLKGGILADEMGLGKTIEAMSIMLGNPAGDADEAFTNLVICPVSLLVQWENEIISKTNVRGYNLKTFVYHGSNKQRMREDEFDRCDVVLTSYGTLVAEHKKLVKYRELLTERPDLELAAPDLPLINHKWYRVILDEAHFIRNSASKSATACMDLKARYRWCMTGTPMQNSADDLFSLIKFLRIPPYDQYHQFRRDFTIPLRSKLSDYSKSAALRKLQAFLKSTMLRRTKDTKLDGRPIIELVPKEEHTTTYDFTQQEAEFYNSLENEARQVMRSFQGPNTVRKNFASVLVKLLRLRQACCHPLLIKFGENVTASDLVSTDIRAQEQLVRKFAPDVVKRIYEEAAYQCCICLDAAIDPVFSFPCGHYCCSDCQPQSDFSDDFDRPKCYLCRTEMKAVITCAAVEAVLGNIPALHNRDTPSTKLALSAATSATMEITDSTNVIFGEDGHVYKDGELFSGALKNHDAQGLPRMYVNGALTVQPEEELFSSTKTEKCIEIIDEIRANYPGEKILVFSQFLQYLRIVTKHLKQKRKINALSYDGSMRSEDRNEALRRFAERDECEVMCISLKAGNVGLNLTCASHAIILDPYWNPATEEQAVGRAHRIGQTKTVHVHRLLIKNTVEERVVALQNRKKDLISSALSERDAQSLSRLSRQELGFLFGMNNL